MKNFCERHFYNEQFAKNRNSFHFTSFTLDKKNTILKFFAKNPSLTWDFSPDQRKIKQIYFSHLLPGTLYIRFSLTLNFLLILNLLTNVFIFFEEYRLFLWSSKSLFITLHSNQKKQKIDRIWLSPNLYFLP